ncbi:MAG: DUF971 domain-containing protein [Candidatus Eisenbacteria bacterium]|uniref:DUF971 domain-containing protein n=1 Tax=Eiseniibacteriota bacterium TaxID=2212470 RepID=A0A7Y2H287_UNCEI|nr:DUF971 domain-containing protein [Candidatus Eisenbacteria bacterium]
MALKRIPVPTEVKIADDGGAIEIRWADGRSTRSQATTLRRQCPCAGCVDEMTGRRTLDPDSIPNNVGIRNYEWVGRYAFQFYFSDSHNTGIFTFEKLREDNQ